MASVQITVTTTPTAIQNLEEDVWYSIQNSGLSGVHCYVVEALVRPTDLKSTDGAEILAGNSGQRRTRDFNLRERGSFNVKTGEGTSIWAWTIEGETEIQVNIAE